MASETPFLPIWELGALHYDQNPVWSWADSDDESLVEPLHGTVLPTDRTALFIKATICLANGMDYPGAISIRCSDWFVYTVTLFVGDHEYELHCILNDDFHNELDRLMSQLHLDQSHVLPITYSTTYTNPVDGTNIRGTIGGA